MIYLASPYSADPEYYYARLLSSAADMARAGVEIYSPILQWHEVAKIHSLPTDAEWWWKLNQHFLRRADNLYVLKYPGWEESAGVKKEIGFWQVIQPHRPIVYMAD